MTDIVKAPPFMPSKPQWDATVKLLERALEELAQAQAERDAARAEVARLTSENDFLNGGAVADKQAIDTLLAENERLTAALVPLIEKASFAWATLDHNEYEAFVSRFGDAIDAASAAMRQPAPAQQISTSDGVTWHTFGGNTPPEQVAKPAPAQGQG